MIDPPMIDPTKASTAEAAQHAVELEQCSLFVDSDPLAKAMTDAAKFLRTLYPTPPADAGEIERLRAENERLTEKVAHLAKQEADIREAYTLRRAAEAEFARENKRLDREWEAAEARAASAEAERDEARKSWQEAADALSMESNRIDALLPMLTATEAERDALKPKLAVMDAALRKIAFLSDDSLAVRRAREALTTAGDEPHG